MSADLTTVKIRCGNETGTGFFVAERIVLSTRHSILPHLIEQSPITVHHPTWQAPLTASPIEPLPHEQYDAVLLRVPDEVPLVNPPPLVASNIPTGAEWRAFGFPAARGPEGAVIEGITLRSIPDNDAPWDLELVHTGGAQVSDYRGLSGAPVTIQGAIRAMLQRRLDGGLGAVSLLRLRATLNAAGVSPYSAQNRERIPSRFRNALDSAVPNSRAYLALDEAIQSAAQHYTTLTGSPGAGKTLLAAGFVSVAEKVEVLGRYFAGTDDATGLPATYYRRSAPFAEWLSGIAALYVESALAITPASTVEQCAQSVARNLTLLSEYCVDKALQGVLLIDDPYSLGAEVSESSNFLSLLPPVPPPGLSIILVVQGRDVLNSAFPELRLSPEIAIPPLASTEAEAVAYRGLPDASYSTVVQLASASGGHPLVLSYILQLFRESPPNSWDPSLLASASGDLREYYENIWLSVGADAQWLLSVVACLRGAIMETELVGFLDGDELRGYPAARRRINHLLARRRDDVSFYHDSFCFFVTEQTRAWHLAIHARLARYCVDKLAAGSRYAARNLLYHKLRADLRPTVELLATCGPNWFRGAALAFSSPELSLADLTEVLSLVLEAGDLAQVVRLLLLRSRLRFRHNQMFFHHAGDLASVCLSLHGPDDASPLARRDPPPLS